MCKESIDLSKSSQSVVAHYIKHKPQKMVVTIVIGKLICDRHITAENWITFIQQLKLFQEGKGLELPFEDPASVPCECDEPKTGVDWYIIENDGTNCEHTMYSGCPKRSFSGCQEFFNKNEFLRDVSRRIRDGMVSIDDDLCNAVHDLPEMDEPLDRDRIVWFKYWIARARKEFGDQARIQYF